MFVRKFTSFLTAEPEGTEGFDDDGMPDSAQGATADQSEVGKLQAELEATKQKASESHDRMLRIAAEFENSRKRWDREREEVRTYCNSEFARDLLPVVDAFEKAMAAIGELTLDTQSEDGKKIGAVIEGIKIVSNTFTDTMKKNGIERVPGKGQPFDPKFHNAVARTVDGAVKQDTVLDEFMPGYKMGDRVLRTAMVRVATPD